MQRSADVTTSTDQTTDFELPQIPVPRKDFVQYVGKHKHPSIQTLLDPYKVFESKLHEGFAVHPKQPVVQAGFPTSIWFQSLDFHDLLRTRSGKLDDDIVNQQ